MKKNLVNHERLDYAWKQAKATTEIEGFEFSSDDERLIKAVSSGEMSREELIKKIKSKKSTF